MEQINRLFPFITRQPFFGEGISALYKVFRVSKLSRQRLFQRQTFIQCHIITADHRFFHSSDPKRTAGDNRISDLHGGFH